MIKTKRIYEKAEKSDGYRILVDRLWPRGIAKERLEAVWMKDIAPSNDLRIWFSHDEKKWNDFRKRYSKELRNKKGLIEEIKKISKKKDVTLLYASKDEEHNEAIVLKDYLEAKK